MNIQEKYQEHYEQNVVMVTGDRVRVILGQGLWGQGLRGQGLWGQGPRGQGLWGQGLWVLIKTGKVLFLM